MRKRNNNLGLLVIALVAVFGYYFHGHSSAFENLKNQANGTLQAATVQTGSARGGVPRATTAQIAQARVRLAHLKVAPPNSGDGYDRDLFGGGWKDPDHNGCDTRKDALRTQGTHVVVGDNCRIESGTWVDPYSGIAATYTNASDISHKEQADHMVPLKEAWRSGANRWTDERRTQLANDLAGLEVAMTSAHNNESKSDRDPTAWKPPLKAFWSTYAYRWISVKTKYGLTIDPAEKRTLAVMLSTPQ